MALAEIKEEVSYPVSQNLMSLDRQRGHGIGEWRVMQHLMSLDCQQGHGVGEWRVVHNPMTLNH